MNRTDDNLSFHDFAGVARVAALSLVMGGLVGCATEDSRNEGARRGAIAGAAVGLTMGALVGDAELAA